MTRNPDQHPPTALDQLEDHPDQFVGEPVDAEHDLDVDSFATEDDQ